VEEETPWFKKPLFLGGLGVAGLLGALALALGRRKKPSATLLAGSPAITGEQQSVDFGIPASQGKSDQAFHEEFDPDAKLHSIVAANPNNLAAHLDLLRSYFGRGDSFGFEEAAREMYAHVIDPDQFEWQEARRMGESIAPHSDLFAMHGMQHAPDAAHATPVFTGSSSANNDAGLGELDFASFGQPPAAAPVAAPVISTNDDFSFDLNLDSPTQKMAAPVAAKSNDDFGLDFNFDLPSSSSIETAKTNVMPTLDMADMDFSADISKPAPSKFKAQDIAPNLPPMNLPPIAPKVIKTEEIPVIDEMLFAGDDAVGTKLDLARAYLDMGDPDGAKAMLEEVMAEGSDSQKSEARSMMGRLG
jgi:pilus assembly protein FimV